MQRVQRGLPDLEDSPALNSYVLHDYLIAARLRRDLNVKSDEATVASRDTSIDQFLQAHSGQPVTHGLRHDWLLSLAQRRRWDWFLPRSVEVSDPVLVCNRLDGRLSTGDTQGLAAAALVRWLAPMQAPSACAPVFAWLREQGLLTPALAETRARAALSAGNGHLGREFAADVPLSRSAALLQWSDLLEGPKAALTVLATHPSLPVEPEALTAGFERLVRADSAAAVDLLARLLARERDEAEQTQLKRAAALGLAYDRDPRAIALFDGLSVDSGDVPALEWRVRAALWSGDYAHALAWIEQLPPALKMQPRWRYWRARAVAATGGEGSEALYGDIAGLRDYYGYLAADHLNQPYSLNMHASPDDPGVQAALNDEPGLIRAHELFLCSMADEATAEWNAALEGTGNALKVQAARLASAWGWYAQSIATLAQTGEFDDVILRYPRPFLDAVNAASRLADVPEDWILAVMRQESLFRKDAVSRADARGLMQMQPATASMVARRWHVAPPGREGLFDPNVAVPLGAAYLRELLDRYGGHLALSLAAYNAGPNAVARWLPPTPKDADVWIENIPFNETRGYVQHILEHIVAFTTVRGAAPARLDSMLAQVAPP